MYVSVVSIQSVYGTNCVEAIMYRLIVILLLTLFIQAIQLPTRSIQVVFIQPQNEEFTDAEQRKVLTDLNAALNYWNVNAPLYYTIVISSTYFLTTTEDILNETNRPVPVEDLAIFVVDNSNSGRYLLQNRFVGIASDTSIWTVTTANAETYAHELGHLLYRLGHHYDQEVDIMNLTPEIAWSYQILGCATAEDVGKPCRKYYLPIVLQ